MTLPRALVPPSLLLTALLLSGAAAPVAVPVRVPAGAATPAPAPNPAAPLPAPFTAPPGFGDTIYPQLGSADLDVTHYDLTLRANPAQDAIQGRAVLSVTALHPLRQISLDFFGPVVSAVKVAGQPARFLQREQKLLIALPTPAQAGASLTLTVAYAGTPGLLYDTSEAPGNTLRLGWITQNGGVYTLSEPDGARTFFPVNDHPADGASYTLHLDVPQGYTAVASGVQTSSVTANGRTVSRFELPQPVPSYALAVQIGRLELTRGSGPGGVALRDAFPPDFPAADRAPFGRAGAMIDFLSGWFGPYPFAVYGAGVTTDPGIPALETATLSTFPARRTSETTALHELAHQWFGDTVRLSDWSQVWLNEGFATYAELLWAQRNGDSAEGVVSGWYSALQRRGTRPLVATDSHQLFDASSYDRGALALHALRLQVGDDRFRQILRLYVSRFGGRAASTADFLGVVSEVGGTAALGAVRPWVEEAGLPPMPAAGVGSGQ